MPSTLRIELTKAGFTVGGAGTAIVVQDYAPATTARVNNPIGSHTITSTDPILDRVFQNGYEWNGHRRVCAYDTNNIYIETMIPYIGAGFKAYPLTAAAITNHVPQAEDRFRYGRGEA
jgi:hypothetical protein